MPRNTVYLLKSIVLFAVYFMTAKFGLRMDALGGFASLIWLPTGFSLAYLLIFGLNLWPAIALGAFFANYASGAPFWAAAGIGVGNTLEAILAAWLLKEKIGLIRSLDQKKQVLWFIVIAGFLATSISATIGTTSLILAGVIAISQFYQTWLVWWVGNMVSNLIIAPLLLIWSVRPYFNMLTKRIWEAVGLSFLLVISNAIIFREVFGFSAHNSSIMYLMFPPLVWAALRFGQRGAITITFILATITILAATVGYGQFKGNTLLQRLFSLQMFVSSTSITALILGAFAIEKEKLEQRKDEFISIASHELKTPLTTIKGYTQILNEYLKGVDKKLLPYTFKMEEQLNRLTRLVNDLLDVSKIQSGKLDLQKERINIDKLIKEVVSDIQLTCNHKIILKNDKKMPRVWVDKYRINQVLVNLISNAIKYSPKANTIHIRSVLNGGIVISVQDFGIGISKNDKEMVFQRFFQAETRIRQSFQGLGLGLYISNQIIKMHGGNMWVDSIKGKGSTFFFMLPTRRRYE